MAELALFSTLVAFVSAMLCLKRPFLLRLARWALGVAAVALLAEIIRRSFQISFPALTRSYEGLTLFSFAVVLILLFRGFPKDGSRRAVVAAGSFFLFLLLALLSSPLISSELRPPVPVLRSHWLVFHVAFAFIGLALFTVGAVAAGLALATDRKTFDRLMEESVALGFVFYVTGGLIFGAIWAESAWGRFWGWDPKETWALITSLFYTGYLHLRYIKGISPRFARILVIVSWFVAGFTYVGVNLLLPGLHSYA